jgi:hypothetical protein
MVALEQLGFGPCYHMRDMLGDIERQTILWERIADGEALWDEILGGAQSTADWPAARYWRELAEHYPEAKVLLTVRDGAGFVRSMRETVWAIYYGDSIMHHLSDARRQIDPLWRRWTDLMIRMTWGPEAPLRGEETHDDASFAGLMDAWDEEVKRTIPAERLLVWDVRDGWGPLCEFLEVDVPAEPLPRINDTDAFKDGIMGGAIAALTEWWAARPQASSGLHGGARAEVPPAEG